MSSEFDLIEAFLRPFPRGQGVRVGPGSDCAAVSVSRGMQLVATTDAVVEGVHFDLERFSPEDVGWKALAVNLSDLAAAGARPRWFLCALGVPKSGRRGQLVRRIWARDATLWTDSGRAAISRRAIEPPNEAPATCAGPRPRWSISAARSSASSCTLP